MVCVCRFVPVRRLVGKINDVRNVILEKYNILLAGVGGTGVITAARLLGLAAIDKNLEVRIGEIHGMAQRGGMISVQVRVGKGVFAPTFMDGEADLLVGFELTEALRNINKLSVQGMAILNDYHIPSSLKKEANIEKHDSSPSSNWSASKCTT